MIAFFDCLHDMEDPQGAAAHALQTLKEPDGVVMIVDPFAADKLEDNLNPVGRRFMPLQLWVVYQHHSVKMDLH